MTSNKNIFQITYPIFLTLIAQNIINVTDTAFLGRVSEVALGASAIAGVYYFAIYVVGFGFSQGAQILTGRRNGEHNYDRIGPIFNNGLIFIILLLNFNTLAISSAPPAAIPTRQPAIFWALLSELSSMDISLAPSTCRILW